MPVSLTISLVVYNPEQQLLMRTVDSLLQAIKFAKEAVALTGYNLTLVDNSEVSVLPSFKPLFDLGWKGHYDLVLATENLGYGRAHNLAINARCGDFHLVLNPDVLVNETALVSCIQCLEKSPLAGMVTPLCFSPAGTQEYLCKAYPSLFILALRGFAPRCIKRIFHTQLAEYDLSNQDNVLRNDVLIASGCFMFFRRQALLDIQGFSEQFFLYFEDFDLSLRLRQHWQIIFNPQARIVHFGGNSAKKGLRHIMLFAGSAKLFFNRHGWRIC